MLPVTRSTQNKKTIPLTWVSNYAEIICASTKHTKIMVEDIRPRLMERKVGQVAEDSWEVLRVEVREQEEK